MFMESSKWVFMSNELLPWDGYCNLILLKRRKRIKYGNQKAVNFSGIVDSKLVYV